MHSIHIHTYIHTNLYSAKNRENESEAHRCGLLLHRTLLGLTVCVDHVSPAKTAEPIMMLFAVFTGVGDMIRRDFFISLRTLLSYLRLMGALFKC